jgi:TetR/AcrR family transcriptional repressor of nem operon
VRYAKDRREKSRAAILHVAARRFREKGFRASGVDDVMSAAGFTAGGFYAHFESKNALLAEALRSSFASGRERLFSGLEGLDGVEWRRAVVVRYLSRSHRDDPGAGCPLPALAGEIAREGKLPRRALEEYLRGLVAEIGPRTPGMPGLSPEERVLATVALLSGALTLSRAVEDRELSDRILSAARRFAVPEPDAAPLPKPGKPKKKPRGAP